MASKEHEVTEWMYHHGELPSDEALAGVAIECVKSWLRNRNNCMDIVAQSELDNAIELLTAMKDI